MSRETYATKNYFESLEKNGKEVEIAEKHKIFVGGLPRSGTTLVQNLLNAHPQVYGGSEFDRIPNIIDLRNKLQQSLKSGRITEYTDAQQIDETIRAVVDVLLEPNHLEPSITHISEKTPWNVLFFDELLTLYPKAKFILVMRNPLSVFNSMKKVAQRAHAKQVIPPDFTTNYRLAVAYMEAVYRLMQRLLKNHPQQVIMVRYEDLLDNLEKTSRTLFQFLEIPWNEQLLSFHEVNHPGERTMTQMGIWYTTDQFRANPAQVKEHTKKNQLKLYERYFITYFFRKNEFVNPNYRFMKEPNTFGKICGKWMLMGYRKKYRFHQLPKRTMG
ncbi:MAG TPA: sulfotransferase [Flavobacteriaceae bacterium]|nr:sulfotransferase [Flavobacteriaceae bacterium]